MAVALETFVKNLTDSGIIAPGKLENFIPPKATPKDAQELARQLVQSKQLTKFQAAEIYHGRAKSLILGNYTILDRVGAGGMGQVFKAEHRRMKRVVAIKMLPKAVMQDAAAVARFQREVEAAAKLRHTNIVATDDADESGGVHFLVMEYIDGADLSATVKKDGPLPAAKAVNYILQAARGLEYAHGEGVIHRDIKPANLLLDKKGTVKILDMGLARIEAGGDTATQAELTGTGAVMGTVDYMAPEQALSTKHAEARSDIYSLGCTLYYLVAGRPTYDGDTLMARLLAHREQPIPALGADVPEQIQAIFEKMVAKNVEDRYRTMSEVVADLQECVGDIAKPSGVAANTRSISGPDSNLILSPTTTFGKPMAGNLASRTQSSTRGNRARKTGILIAVAAAALSLAVLGAFLLTRGPAAKEPATSVGISSAKGPESIGPPPIAKAPFDTRQARAHQEAWANYLGTHVETTNSIGMKMILIPPGEFLMGSSDEQVEAAVEKSVERGEESWAQGRIRNAERPQHKVVLTKPLAMSATEITIGQFRQFIERSKYVSLAERLGGDSHSNDELNSGNKQRNWRSPGYIVDDELPVTQVASPDAAAFCNWLCEQEKLPPSYRHDGHDGWAPLAGATGYRLPTEAQWEYACRAGTTTQYSFGDDPAELGKFGWYSQNSGGIAHAVGLKPANPFGLYDMHGNVEELCSGWLDDNGYAAPPQDDPDGPLTGIRRVFRGGHLVHYASSCRSAFRYEFDGLSPRYNYFGFRVIRTLEAPRAIVDLDRPATRSSPAVESQPVLPANATSPPPVAKAPFDAKQARAHQDAWAKHLGTQVETANSIGMKMILIPPGEFLMGSSDKQVAAAVKKSIELNDDQWTRDGIRDAERPQHRVDIRRPFRLSATETTIAQFRKFVEAKQYVTLAEKFGGGSDSSDEKQPGNKSSTWHSRGYVITDESPVTEVAWTEAAEFCNWLCQQEQLPPSYAVDSDGDWRPTASAVGYRLPTEAEWEYACRAGTTTQFSFGDDSADLPDYGWYSRNSGGVVHQVGLKLMNPFGLYDMHGNVEEWCQDWWEVDYYSTDPAKDPPGLDAGLARAHRGGYFSRPASICRCAFRGGSDRPKFRLSLIGFRVVRTLDATPTTTAANANLESSKPPFAWEQPQFKQWEKQVAGMPAEEQVKAVVQGLQKLNSGFDGTVTPKIEGGVVTGLQFVTDKLADLSPLRALVGLKSLTCIGSPSLSDLSPLQGMKLTALECSQTNVADLSPLRGMPLVGLTLIDTPVSDLSPLGGMPLTSLNLDHTQVRDLSPLAGMRLTLLHIDHSKVVDLSPIAGVPLAALHCRDTQISDLKPVAGMPCTELFVDKTPVTDLSPLATMKLQTLLITPANIAKGMDDIRQMKSLTVIGAGWADNNRFPAAEFWQKYDAGEFKKSASEVQSDRRSWRCAH